MAESTIDSYKLLLLSSKFLPFKHNNPNIKQITRDAYKNAWRTSWRVLKDN